MSEGQALAAQLTKDAQEENPILFNEFEFCEHTDTLHKTQVQPSAHRILDRNNELRKSPGALQDLKYDNGESFGRLLCTIPQVVYNNAIKAGYDLNCKDSDIAGREMPRFLSTDMGRACLVQ